MSLAVVYSRAQVGVDAPLVTVEAHLSNGLPSLSIVGLPEAAVKESKDRVRGALLNSQYDFPARRITINLAPADLPKEGARFDLSIAIGILASSEQIPAQQLDQYEFIGELALSGIIRPVTGLLAAAIAARDASRTLVVPKENQAEALLVSGCRVLVAEHLLTLCAHLSGAKPLPIAEGSGLMAEPVESLHDLAEVRGQSHAKRALEIAAAGGHSLLMVGPPGTGKTMLASRLPGILPLLTEQEALESAAINSLRSAHLETKKWGQRPFRSPHHTASAVALVGGGSNPQPGEISLAHHGVLFLDELPEFDRKVLEVLREPLESGCITISRAARQAEYPARFQLITAMNPCPCGYHGHYNGRCRCTGEQVQRYRSKISGPLLDRLDIHIEVPALPPSQLQGTQSSAVSESSVEVRERVVTARLRMQLRGVVNSRMNNKVIEKYCLLSEADQALLIRAIDRLGLSARAYYRILKVARTIADLALCEEIQTAHLSEAISYRRLDRAL
ncbi:MAG: YifB family Mg chelatase-like AAA ATPase [Gammaproteobacteria bacterium]|nr:YifB family Mg chelatase-like AAA ATPase [Gammaproteobacteria bacterium]MCF6230616.1 YifB family Mg chelatase-like AAA ATPase [Gammaproteobacteria bacterium]